MDYAQAVASLNQLAQFGWKLDLARIGRLCELAGHPERDFRSILVAGTNGKGSVCALLGSILNAARLRVGEAPKPHLHSFRERAVVDGTPLSEAEFATLMTEMQPWLAQVKAEAGAPTVFEALTLLALMRFARAGVDYAVVEVGLGGRFDATNVLPATHCVITNIALDHTDRLGDSLPAIAAEKAGILKAGTRLITGARPPALGVIEARAAELEVPVWRLGQEIRLSQLQVDGRGGRFDLQTPAGELAGLAIRLLGAHQVENAALAAAAALRMRLDGAPLPDSAIRAGLANASLPARLQVLRRNPTVVVDGAHNPAAARAVARSLRDLFLTDPRARLWLVLGLTSGHDGAGVAAALVPLAAGVFATAAAHPRAVPPAEVARVVESAAGGEVREVPEVTAAYRAALAAAAPEDVVCVTGSLFVAAEVLPAQT